MDRNSVIGFILIGIILVGYSIWMQPSPEELEKIKLKRDSIAQIDEQQKIAEKKANAQIKEASAQEEAKLDTLVANDSIQRAEIENKFGSFAPSAIGEPEFHFLENDLIRVKLTNKGGYINSVYLKDYKTHNGEPLYVVRDSTNFNLNFFSDNRLINTSDLFFELVESSSENGIKKLSLRAKTNQSNKYIQYNYSLSPDGYSVDYEVELSGMREEIARNAGEVAFNWSLLPASREKNIENERNASTIYYRIKGDDVDYISERNFEKLNLEAGVEWISFKQQFFSAVIISKDGFDKSNGVLEIKESPSNDFIKDYFASATILFESQDVSKKEMSFYFGPNHYQTLKDFDLKLEEQIDLGWWIIGIFSRWLVIPIFNFLDDFHLNYGIIILILTIIIKMIISPLTYKNYLSSAKMKVLKPDIDALNEKHKNADPMKKQQATMSLYREAGVNPMAGCVPMLLQFPILFAMFKFFPASIELRQQSFLWADDLSSYDSIFDLPFEIPFYGDHVSLFTLLMAISVFLVTKYNTQMSMGSGPQAAQMKIIMYFMPFMLLFFFNGYSAGLSYYYFLSNIISVGQQLVIKRFFIDEDKIRAKIQANKAKPKNQKKSSFQKRLEEMAKKRGIDPNNPRSQRK